MPTAVLITSPEGLQFSDPNGQTLTIDTQSNPGRLTFRVSPSEVSIDSECIDYLLRFFHEWAHTTAQAQRKD